MTGDKLNSIDDYERFIEAKIEAWSSEQRVALGSAGLGAIARMA